MLENYKKPRIKVKIRCKLCNTIIKSLFEDWEDLIKHLQQQHKDIIIDGILLSKYGEIIETK